MYDPLQILQLSAPSAGRTTGTMTDVTVLKTTARAVWAAGDYDTMAGLIWAVGGRIVDRLAVEPGEAVLDVACGTGNAAIPAALAGGRVVGLDLTPELFAPARRRAEAAGVTVNWVEGDAEDLPFGDGAFDVVLSTFGVMFAPRHEIAAAELARVVRPGGRFGLANWTPDGNIGALFRTVAGHAPPPAGVASPILWGTEGHVEELFAAADVALELHREEVVFDFASVEDALTTFTTRFGPIVKARERLEPEGRWEALRDDLEALFAERGDRSTGRCGFAGEYLVVVGRAAG